MSDKTRIMIGTADVTEHVARMFDAIIGSVDWGSGFMDTEDVESMIVIAELAGFDGPDFGRNVGFEPPGFPRWRSQEPPDEAMIPVGGWPADPKVYARAMKALSEHRDRERELFDAHNAAKADAIRAWRAQVQAKARAMRDDAEEGHT